MAKKKKKKKRSYLMRPRAEIRKILKEYDRAEHGRKYLILEKHGVGYSNIQAYRERLAS